MFCLPVAYEKECYQVEPAPLVWEASKGQRGNGAEQREKAEMLEASTDAKGFVSCRTLSKAFMGLCSALT